MRTFTVHSRQDKVPVNVDHPVVVDCEPHGDGMSSINEECVAREEFGRLKPERVKSWHDWARSKTEGAATDAPLRVVVRRLGKDRCERVTDDDLLVAPQLRLVRDNVIRDSGLCQRQKRKTSACAQTEAVGSAPHDRPPMRATQV